MIKARTISRKKVSSEDFARLDIGDHSSAVSLLAKELNELSVQERDLISDEIHGVRGVICPEETPEMLEKSLAELSMELSCLPPTTTKQAYEESLKYPESYIHTDDFRLIFLRVELFDAHKAAVRMMKYLDLINWAFGKKVLQRDISLADFDNKGREYLRAGYQQIFPGMDRSGRRVGGNFLFPVNPDQPIKNRIKSVMYVIMATAKNDVNAQRKGVVGVNWAIEMGDLADLQQRFWVHKRMEGAWPVRYCAFHCCLPNSNKSISPLISTMYLNTVGKENRQRIRFHHGSATECLYALQTFGIPSIHIPINTTTGKIKTANHHQWLQMQQIQEAALLENKTFDGIECPRQGDVLFGRGWPKMSHPGNAIFRNILEARLEQYNSIQSKKEKTAITRAIVSQIKDSGARFLRQDDSGFWMEVPDDIARQKVSIGFRDIRKAKQKLIASSLVAPKPGLSSKRKVGNYDGNSSEEDASPFGFLDGGKRHRSQCDGCLCIK